MRKTTFLIAIVIGMLAVSTAFAAYETILHDTYNFTAYSNDMNADLSARAWSTAGPISYVDNRGANAWQMAGGSNYPGGIKIAADAYYGVSPLALSMEQNFNAYGKLNVWSNFTPGYYLSGYPTGVTTGRGSRSAIARSKPQAPPMRSASRSKRVAHGPLTTSVPVRSPRVLFPA